MGLLEKELARRGVWGNPKGAPGKNRRATLLGGGVVWGGGVGGGGGGGGGGGVFLT